MRLLAYHLVRRGIAIEDTLAVVPRAKVPIIKFTDRDTGIKVDISFENDSGLKANATFQKWKEEYPALPTIAVVIKQLMAMRDLNEVVSGGIGGFSIICLVVSMMQMMPEVQSGSMEPEHHFGDLLLNFFDLYGNKFNIKTTGIMVGTNPGYFSKLRHPMPQQNDNRLTIVDPNRPDNDISGGTRNIGEVLNVFREAHSAIQRKLHGFQAGEDGSESLLACILGGNYSSFIRQREKLSMLQRGFAISPPPQQAPPPPKKDKGRNKRGQNKPNQGNKPNLPTQSRPVIPLPPKPVAPNQPGQPKRVRKTPSRPASAPWAALKPYDESPSAAA